MIEFDKNIPEILKGKFMWALIEEGIDNVLISMTQIGPDEWDWVGEDYCALFKPFGKEPHLRECKKRMKAVFKEDKELTQDLVIKATKLYLSEQREAKYVREPHYFIFKGSGISRTDDLLGWVDKVRNSTPQQRDITETIQ